MTYFCIFVPSLGFSLYSLICEVFDFEPILDDLEPTHERTTHSSRRTENGKRISDENQRNELQRQDQGTH